MKPAYVFALICCSTVFTILSGNAQEHVDVPLPPYDPPPTVLHRSRPSQDETTRDTAKPGAYRHFSETAPKKQTEKNYPYRKQKRTEAHSTHHRSKTDRRKNLHWPWQHHK
jgi:hypothetical protein